MDSIEQTIFELLSSDESLVAIVGDRIYPNYVPKGRLLPAVTYQRIGGAGDYNIEGRSDVGECLFQVNGWASTYEAAVALSDAIIECLDGLATGPIGMIEVSAEGDVPDLSAENDQLDAYGRRLEFRIHYET